jgi:hypothetical protein
MSKFLERQVGLHLMINNTVVLYWGCSHDLTLTETLNHANYQKFFWVKTYYHSKYPRSKLMGSGSYMVRESFLVVY